MVAATLKENEIHRVHLRKNLTYLLCGDINTRLLMLNISGKYGYEASYEKLTCSKVRGERISCGFVYNAWCF